MSDLYILGIETSCDDTSIAIIKGSKGQYATRPDILTHKRFSQDTMLEKWGGVVPEIASRNHLKKLVPLLEECFKEAKLSPKDIHLTGVTTHPGLLGPLLTGINAAKTLALLYQTPLVPINHLFAHLEAIFLTKEVPYPYLGLLISGGHSMYFLVTSPTDFEILGSTIDDAAGEALDKAGKLLGLGYPAGKVIDDMAKEGDKNKYKFPIGLKSSSNATLSFSGTKTSLRLFLENTKDYKLSDVCASYQEAVIGALCLKLKYAIKKAKEKTRLNLPIVVGGGVACNSSLRHTLGEKYKDNVHFVAPAFCTDNGAMIANYALRTYDDQIGFPECLKIDAKSRYISKKTYQVLNHE
ncbi:MAG: tRNA (adenosine(37)-N6)-threonylcarbamoyltransferase complex transferase subunit TsaD [Bdellovibrionales bacterium RIFOXYB1_FULL_37_110]|nr:MAG: tRNA (adenosine(37)-N6)-threonylcarbamoyltransferase complex transferase subunit TsaD [Bdellovibrionales bacterium RIFOXYA1_FULL_38_20]OFZ45465.1 MAG: tRNA (adenosine(37)-N6)-threonylcarbamoyltransferase complex transferase subunit TsaD [Bdellovibrionales bacterium RIFOXYC1_FULL_37_79]OFZ61021.1 MAG: tRNA (adenosine(37)-N6)-threonylcarbamoyltransferase complex transferase subunit TsaD [Bdellovibrionales bacterium RIFOXYB1_FULL_37_110]OFZ63472.1 MAG: tRNA (adenosine(37)-N6)-threonylcarbam